MKLWLIVIVLLSACGHDRPCDPGQVFEHGLCYAPPDGGVASDAP